MPLVAAHERTIRVIRRAGGLASGGAAAYHEFFRNVASSSSSFPPRAYLRCGISTEKELRYVRYEHEVE